MALRAEARLATALVAVLVLSACVQAPTPAAQVSGAATAEPAVVTAVAGGDAHFNPTEAAGGGANAGIVIASTDVAGIFTSIPTASQLDLTANSSPPGATGPNVVSVSVIGTDRASLFKSLGPDAKRTLGDALLTAAAGAWPNASVSLLVTDPSGVGGQVIGSRGKAGPNTVIVS